MRGGLRWCAVLLLVSAATPAYAEWQIKPFLGVTFGVDNTFVDTDLAAQKIHPVIGGSGALIGEVLGVEADFSRAQGFYQTSLGGNVLSSAVTTLTGNVTVALPRRMTEYTLRPYFVGGAGLMRVGISQRIATLNVAENLTALDVGAGVTGFLTRRVGLSWDVRRFRSLRGPKNSGLTIGGQPERLAFWRADMALAFRY